MFDSEMNTKDALLAKFARIYVTIGDNRYLMAMAKDFEAKANITTKEAPALGSVITPYKATGVKIPVKMTIYKCTEIFDDLVENYIKTGILKTFDIQTSNEDPSSSVGASIKIYNDVVLDGDVLLSMAKVGDDFIEQEISGYASSYGSESKFRNPEYM